MDRQYSHACVSPPARGSSELSEDLALRRKQAEGGGGQSTGDELRAAGRGTARERLDTLLDEGSFVEVDTFVTHRNQEFNLHMHPFEGDGVVCGHGSVAGMRLPHQHTPVNRKTCGCVLSERTAAPSTRPGTHRGREANRTP